MDQRNSHEKHKRTYNDSNRIKSYGGSNKNSDGEHERRSRGGDYKQRKYEANKHGSRRHRRRHGSFNGRGARKYASTIKRDGHKGARDMNKSRTFQDKM